VEQIASARYAAPGAPIDNGIEYAMTLLVAGLLIFFAVHSVRIGADNWRTAQIARHGPKTWKGVYTVASVVGLVLIIWGYGVARQSPVVLYVPPVWTRHLAALLTLVAFVMIAAAYVPKTRIKAKIRHPMVAGVKVWAFAHLLANGTLADALLFGSFLAWAVLHYSAAMRRDRAANVSYEIGPLSRDITAVVIGTIVWLVFTLWLHRVLIGVQPLGNLLQASAPAL